MLEKIFLGASEMSEGLAFTALSDQRQKDIGKRQLGHTRGKGSLKIFHGAGGRIKRDVGKMAAFDLPKISAPNGLGSCRQNRLADDSDSFTCQSNLKLQSLALLRTDTQYRRQSTGKCLMACGTIRP